MPGVARNAGVDVAGGPIIQGSGSVLANNAPVARIGDAIAGHGRSPHNAPVMAAGSGNVFANNIGISRAGDAASCGHTASGSSNVFINDPSGTIVSSTIKSVPIVTPPPPKQYQYITGGSEGVATSFVAGPGGGFVPGRELVSGRDYWPVNIYPWNYSPQIMDLRPFTPIRVEYQDWNLENQINNIANPPAIVYTWNIYEKTFQSASSYTMGFEVFTFSGDDRIFRPHSYAYSLLPLQQQKDLIAEYRKKYDLNFIVSGSGYSWKDGPYTTASKEWRSFLIEKGVNLPINEIAVIKHGDTFRWDGSEWQLEEKHVRAVYVPKE